MATMDRVAVLTGAASGLGPPNRPTSGRDHRDLPPVMADVPQHRPSIPWPPGTPRHGYEEQAAFEDQPRPQAVGHAGWRRYFQIHASDRMILTRSERCVDASAS